MQPPTETEQWPALSIASTATSVDEGYSSREPSAAPSPKKQEHNGSDLVPASLDYFPEKINSVLPERTLKEMSKTRKVMINVSEGLRKQPVCRIPVAVLFYYSPALKAQSLLQLDFTTVFLPGVSRTEVYEFCRFALAGGKGEDGEAFQNPAIKTNILVNRLKVMLTLGFYSTLVYELWEELEKRLFQGVATFKHIEWIYKRSTVGTIGDYQKWAADRIFQAVVLSSTIKVALENASKNETFNKVTTDLLIEKHEEIYEHQTEKKIALSISALRFIYAFSEYQGDVRGAAVMGLAKLIEEGILEETNPRLVDYRSKHADFDEDLAWAIGEFAAFKEEREASYQDYLEREKHRERVAKAKAREQAKREEMKGRKW